MEIEYIVEWFKYADGDLLSAERLNTFHPKNINIICFHCQQSAEKYLKGYLMFKGTEEPPKIHNLNILCDLCVKIDPKFEKIYEACEVLNVYGVQPRYPHEMEITESDMQKALAYAAQVKDFEPLAKVRKQLTANSLL